MRRVQTSRRVPLSFWGRVLESKKKWLEALQGSWKFLKRLKKKSKAKLDEFLKKFNEPLVKGQIEIERQVERADTWLM